MLAFLFELTEFFPLFAKFRIMLEPVLMEWINSLCDVGYIKTCLTIQNYLELLWTQRTRILRSCLHCEVWGLAMVLIKNKEVLSIAMKFFAFDIKASSCNQAPLKTDLGNYGISPLWRLWETQTISEFTTSWPWLHWIWYQVLKLGKIPVNLRIHGVWDLTDVASI